MEYAKHKGLDVLADIQDSHPKAYERFGLLRIKQARLDKALRNGVTLHYYGMSDQPFYTIRLG